MNWSCSGSGCEWRAGTEIGSRWTSSLTQRIMSFLSLNRYSLLPHSARRNRLVMCSAMPVVSQTSPGVLGIRFTPDHCVASACASRWRVSYAWSMMDVGWSMSDEKSVIAAAWNVGLPDASESTKATVYVENGYDPNVAV